MHVHSNAKTVLSRFHWHVATIWTAPIEEDNKPSVKFTKAIHTPIAKSKSYDYRYLDIEPTMPLKERIEIVNFYLPLFDRLLKGVEFGEEAQGYDKIIREGGVSEKYLFKLSEIKRRNARAEE